MSQDPKHRESAFRIFASVPQLILDQKTEEVAGVMERGLKDPQSVDVQLAALKASAAFLTTADKETQVEASHLMSSMLGVSYSLCKQFVLDPIHIIRQCLLSTRQR